MASMHCSLQKLPGLYQFSPVISIGSPDSSSMTAPLPEASADDNTFLTSAPPKGLLGSAIRPSNISIFRFPPSLPIVARNFNARGNGHRAAYVGHALHSDGGVGHQRRRLTERPRVHLRPSEQPVCIGCQRNVPPIGDDVGWRPVMLGEATRRPRRAEQLHRTLARLVRPTVQLPTQLPRPQR